MPPVSSEQSYTPESLKKSKDQYMAVERGDVTPSPPSNSSQSNSDNQQQGNTQQQKNGPQPQKQFDPVEFVKSIISSGFTPTKAQIMNAKNNTEGPQDSSNTWFAILLSRLIKQEKNRKSRDS